MSRPYGHILDSTCTAITRAIYRDGAWVLQRFTAPVEITLSPDALLLLGALEEAADPVLQRLAADGVSPSASHC